ncbi:hypothetical protein B0H34DRAFT_677609 [Crassisporium funariophilum]|nr:hypothetical protein B0H34DRAFT_677609 [Crassisporium funariophilum]
MHITAWVAFKKSFINSGNWQPHHCTIPHSYPGMPKASEVQQNVMASLAGFYREHAHNTSTEFVNEGDLEEAFQSLDDGEVHYAPWATLAHSESFAKTTKYTLVVPSLHLEIANKNLALNMRL